MNFLEYQDAVIEQRFNELYRARIKRWLNLRYNSIWNHAPWTFKTTSVDIVVTAGDNSPPMPGDLAKVLSLYNSNGDELLYLERDEWEACYAFPNSGRAEAYTVINRQVYLGPQQVLGETLGLAYKRRLAHVDAILGVTGGTLIENTDQPWWPAEHDETLVVDTLILGMQLEQDAGWRDLVPQRDGLLEGMVEDLCSDVDEQPVFWGGRWRY